MLLIACQSAYYAVLYYFPGVRKMVEFDFVMVDNMSKGSCNMANLCLIVLLTSAKRSL
jgi:hypothetical protein